MAYLNPSPKMQFFDANGAPLVSGKLYTYAAGTLTPQVTYIDQAQSGTNTNPVILDSRGEANVWLSTTGLYKWILKDSTDATIWTVDNIGYQYLTANDLYDQGIEIDVASATTTDIGVQNSCFLRITGTNNITSLGTNYNGPRYLRFAGTLTITHNASTLILPGSANLTVGAGDVLIVAPKATSGTSDGWYVVGYQKASGFGTAAYLNVGTSANNLVQLNSSAQLPAVDGSQLTYLKVFPYVRQTVLSGPVDSGGLPNFGGSTGSATVTATGSTLLATVATGDYDYIGSITSPSWTGLSTDGTMFLYLEIDSAGVVTTGSTTLVPVYQVGGTYSTTSGQHTFNIQEMTMKVGNGSAANQVYRVFVGEVTVAGNVVTAITWYALMGRYFSGYTNTLPGSATSVSKNHNIGTTLIKTGFRVKNLTGEASYVAGDVEPAPWRQSGASNSSVIVPVVRSRLSMQASTGNSLSIGGFDPTNGGAFLMTAANWAYELWAERDF